MSSLCSQVCKIRFRTRMNRATEKSDLDSASYPVQFWLVHLAIRTLSLLSVFGFISSNLDLINNRRFALVLAYWFLASIVAVPALYLLLRRWLMAKAYARMDGERLDIVERRLFVDALFAFGLFLLFLLSPLLVFAFSAFR